MKHKAEVEMLNERQGTISHGAPPGRSDVGRRRVAAEDPPMMMPLGLSHDEQVNLDGIVNDAMGYVQRAILSMPRRCCVRP